MIALDVLREIALRRSTGYTTALLSIPVSVQDHIVIACDTERAAEMIRQSAHSRGSLVGSVGVEHLKEWLMGRRGMRGELPIVIPDNHLLMTIVHEAESIQAEIRRLQDLVEERRLKIGRLEDQVLGKQMRINEMLRRSNTYGLRQTSSAPRWARMIRNRELCRLARRAKA